VTNREFTQTLGRVLRRPTLLHAPSIALRAVLGEMADEMLLASVRVYPRRLLEAGFSFSKPDLEAAL
jgi:NAD dependent epimerase/dehydratase family enzyme